MRTLATFAAALILSGCSLIPDFAKPAAPVPVGWPEGPAYRRPAPVAANAPSADMIGWQEFFQDGRLRDVIALSLTNNRDLRVAALNVAQSEAQVRVQRGALFPDLGLTGSLDANRSPADLSRGGSSSGPPRASTSRTWSVGPGFTAYELDLFGRVRALSEQAFRQYLGFEETRRSTQISLVSQVANAWMAIAADQALVLLTQQTLVNQRDGYALTLAGFRGGTVTELALRQAQTSVETAQANLAQYTRQLAQDRNALDLLVGSPVSDGLLPSPVVDATVLAGPIPEGLSSEILLRRPDVMAAEQNLLASNANIGAARAAFFPSITLTASAGTASASFDGLFRNGSGAWTFAPQINIPIFNGGINRANLDAAKVQRDAQVADYERTIQTAFREVADQLAARGTYDDEIAAQRRLVDAYDAAYRLSLLRFRSGLDTFQSPLDSQRQLYAAQQTLIGLELARLQGLVTLYKALGGGWSERTIVAAAVR